MGIFILCLTQRIEFHQFAFEQDIFSSVQFTFTSVYLAKINYNTRIHIRILSWQGSPEEIRRLMKPELPSHNKCFEQDWIETARSTRICMVSSICKSPESLYTPNATNQGYFL